MATQRRTTSGSRWPVFRKAGGQDHAHLCEQAGVPLLTIKEECTGKNTTVSVSQQRYFYDRDALNGANDQLWQIPICMKTPQTASNTAGKCELLTKKEDTFTVPGCPAWVLANAGGNGYYRSGYQPEVVHALAKYVETSLTPVERIILLSDTWAAVRVGRQPVGDYLTLAEGLHPNVTMLSWDCYSQS